MRGTHAHRTPKSGRHATRRPLRNDGRAHFAPAPIQPDPRDARYVTKVWVSTVSREAYQLHDRKWGQFATRSDAGSMCRWH